MRPITRCATSSRRCRGARRLASVLEKKRLTRVGRFTDNGALQQEIARPLSEKEKKLQTIGDRQVGQQFYNDAMRRFKYRISGREMIDTRDWPATPHEREARVSAGFERLVEFCGGDEAEARRLTLFAHQGPAAPVLIALVNPDHAARLPDDSVGYVTPNSHYNTNAEQAEYNFSRSTSGRPQLDIRYSLVGRNTFNDLNTAKQTILSPDSVVRVHLRAELADDDTLQLLEPPSYRFYVRPDDFQKQYPPPHGPAHQQSERGQRSPVRCLGPRREGGHGSRDPCAARGGPLQGCPGADLARCGRGRVRLRWRPERRRA